ncbi:DUF1559 domain-containing protein [Blastopirellula marina]|uniref:DUF1559 domain-containing protein n=1 Tax=Blastopirellula marina TaxID=124 RepID=A0A2S8G140_9BACT|nr:DUF1559 domain-containing protein [Blastopirellula marina]PQO37971.1 hypothetical protein C5Y98_07715 [Blastopirellula marina]PTL44627.1 DUF1559 domain-containing protein [Blastopirellula marina]
MSKKALFRLKVIGVGLAVLIALAIPAVYQYREMVRSAECENRLRFISLALVGYHGYFGRFPPSQTKGHSWRVCIFPHLVDDPFYGLYRFEEPWNSSWNHELERRRITATDKWNVVAGEVDTASPYSMAEFLWQCPCDLGPKSPHTSYVMLVGPHAAGRKVEGVSIDEITDDPATTILIAEIASHEIEWLQPKDLEVETMSFQINDPEKPSISSHHPHGPHVVFCDGKVGQLGPDLPPEVLKAMITIDGGEKIVQDENAPGGYRLADSAESSQ